MTSQAKYTIADIESLLTQVGTDVFRLGATAVIECMRKSLAIPELMALPANEAFALAIAAAEYTRDQTHATLTEVDGNA